jgi:phage repressor protein C with HTH and peptisase S24 domain
MTTESTEEFWERVKALLADKKMTQEALADAVDVSYASFKQLIYHGRLPSVYVILKMAQTLGTTLEFLAYGQSPKPVAKSDQRTFYVPILNQKLSAGYGQQLNDDTETLGYMEVPRFMRQYGEKLALLYVDGDSMEPTLRRGDLVLCDSCGYDGEGLYAVQYDGDAFVKRVFKMSNKYIIKPDNPLYPQMEEPVESDNIAIVGRVHYIIKKCD